MDNVLREGLASVNLNLRDKVRRVLTHVKCIINFCNIIEIFFHTCTINSWILKTKIFFFNITVTHIV